jgi:hypothetical protein
MNISINPVIILQGRQDRDFSFSYIAEELTENLNDLAEDT